MLTAVWLLFGLGGLLPSVIPAVFRSPDALNLFYPVKSAAECAVFLWAARRAALGPRLRLALRVTALAYAASAALAAWWALGALAPGLSIPPAADTLGTFATYVLGVAGILLMPTVARRAPWWTLLVDVSTTVLGFGAALAVVVTLPQLQGAAEGDRAFFWVYGAAQVLMLIGLNLLVLRGDVRPGRRAFWLFVAGIAGNLITVIVAQLEIGHPALGTAASNLTAVGTSLCSIWAGAAFARHPIAPGSRAPGPSWFATLNPLPMAATLAVAALLLRSAFEPGTLALRALAVTLVVQSALLVARVMATSLENARLLYEEHDRRHRQQEDKARAVGRLAGGVAHWLNNQLTTVIGYAELGAEDARAGSDAVQQDLVHIRRAAAEAAQVVDRLLSFSGRQLHTVATVPLGALLSAADGLDGRRIAVTCPPDVARLHVGVDQRLMEYVVRELLVNAHDATPAEGRVDLRVSVVRLEAPLDGATLPVGPGRFAVVEVADSGRGIAPGMLAVLFDPFVSTKPAHQGAGLGLPAVYGIVASHRGGLTVDSSPGQGTRVRVYLPLPEPA